MALCCMKGRRVPIDSMEETKIVDITLNETKLETTVDNVEAGQSSAGVADNAASAAGSSPEEPEDPDALTNKQVIAAVIMLMMFSVSFATLFFLAQTAIVSIDADINKTPVECGMVDIKPIETYECDGTHDKADCIHLKVRCQDNTTYTAFEYYHDYFNKPRQCSVTRCSSPDKVINNLKYPISFIRRCCTRNSSLEDYTAVSYSANVSELKIHMEDLEPVSAEFYRDNRRPEAVFYQINEPGTNRIIIPIGLSYALLIFPTVIMLVISLGVIGSFLAGKLEAKAVYRPLTPITPLHKQYKGKWYIKERSSTAQKQTMSAFEKLKQLKKEAEESGKKQPKK